MVYLIILIILSTSFLDVDHFYFCSVSPINCTGRIFKNVLSKSIRIVSLPLSLYLYISFSLSLSLPLSLPSPSPPSHSHSIVCLARYSSRLPRAAPPARYTSWPSTNLACRTGEPDDHWSLQWLLSIQQNSCGHSRNSLFTKSGHPLVKTAGYSKQPGWQ